MAVKVLNTHREFKDCNLGLYKIYWTEDEGGGYSYASVGQTYDGTRWIAPTNWTTGKGKKNPTALMPEIIDSIEKMEWVGGHNKGALGSD